MLFYFLIIMLELQLGQNQKLTIITDETIDQMSDEEYLAYIGLTQEQYENWLDLIEELEPPQNQ
jgi:hypothetical protein